MTSFLGQEETLDVFKCPNCQHFNSSKAEKCGKCSMPFSLEQKQAAIAETKRETKEHNVKYYKNMMFVGAMMFLVCGGLTLVNIITVYLGRGGTFSGWLILIALAGVGEMLWSLRGWRTESMK